MLRGDKNMEKEKIEPRKENRDCEAGLARDLIWKVMV